jgi:hypothetical protein
VEVYLVNVLMSDVTCTTERLFNVTYASIGPGCDRDRVSSKIRHSAQG